MSSDLLNAATLEQESNPSNLPTRAQQLDALLAEVLALSKLALDIVQRSIDLDDKVVSKLAVDLNRHSVAINNQIPQVVRSHIDAAIAEICPAHVFYQGTAPTPAKLDALFPPGQGDNKAYHVVCVRRAPGLYDTV
ncbi:hypothetical protein B0H14DRAFT_2591104 [Mycena olivaceomarginata]|nr:hypothetical protein B0H14DRAFT_2591104 [Mycena olivaceomarginata]